MTVINFDDHFRDRMGKVDRGHIEVFPKLWSLRPYNKTTGEITRIPRLTASYHKLREETKSWGDYKKLPEEIPEFPLIGRMLPGADSVVKNPRLRAFETNERRVAKFSEIRAPCFVGRNAAVLQYSQFPYKDETTRRRMNNAATPRNLDDLKKIGQKLDLAPMVMRGKADLQEASLILMSVQPELVVRGKLQTRAVLVLFGCEKVKVMHGEEEDRSAGRLVVPKFPDGTKNKSKDPRVQERIQSETMSREEAVDRKNLCNRIPIKPTKNTIRRRQEGYPAWTSISSAILKTARTRWKRRLSQQTRDLPRWNLRRSSWEQKR